MRRFRDRVHRARMAPPCPQTTHRPTRSSPATGGPGTTTESLTLYAVQVGLRNLDLGYAATLAWALMAFVIAFAVVYLNALRNRIPEV